MFDNMKNIDLYKELVVSVSKETGVEKIKYTNAAGEFQLDKCAKILDCGKYLDSMIAVISRNWENPTFYPTVEQLRTFREKIEKAAE